MFKAISAPIVLQWEVTPRCNHNCVHCYNYWRKGPRLPLLPENYEDIFTKVVDEIIENKVFAVVITGGEPLLVIETIGPFIKRLVSNGIKVTMNTNLTLLNAGKAKLLKEIGISSLLVSLPSGNSDNCDRITNRKGSLAKIIRGIRIATAHGFPVFTNMVVSRINKGDIEVTAQLAKSLGLRNFAVTRASKPVKDGWFSDEILSLVEFRQMLDELYQIEEKYGLNVDTLEANPACAYSEEHFGRVRRFCTAGKTTATVGCNGEIRPCNRLPLVYGNISDGFSPAWGSMKICRENEWIPEACAPCKVRARCGGGCKADALIEYGDLSKPDPLCDLSNLPILPKKALLTVTSETFIVNPLIKIRPESFGAIAYINIANWLPITMELALLLLEGGIITTSDLARVLGVSIDSVQQTAGVLVDKKILQPMVAN